MNGEEDFIQMPLGAWPRTTAPELIRIRLPELPAPLPNGLIRHDDATGEQELFHVAVAETEPEIEPHPVADDLSWEAVVLVTVRRWYVHALSIAHQPTAGQAAQ
jgi:hypothetical protein